MTYTVNKNPYKVETPLSDSSLGTSLLCVLSHHPDLESPAQGKKQEYYLVFQQRGIPNLLLVYHEFISTKETISLNHRILQQC